MGFTSMAGNMRPIQVMKMLNELYTELDKIVEKHASRKDPRFVNDRAGKRRRRTPEVNASGEQLNLDL